MTTAPIITIFVRHKDGCKYQGEEQVRRCRCPKFLRWSQNGKQYKKTARTRSWEEAENVKQELLLQLTGKGPAVEPEVTRRGLLECVELFTKDKKVRGVTKGVLGKYERELKRLRVFLEGRGVYAVQGITRELLTEFLATWEDLYPSGNTRAKARERLRSFLRYCYEAQWLPRIPALPKITADEPETLPLTAAEYQKLIDAPYALVTDNKQAARVRALFQLMRFSGLAIRDALTLERAEIVHDAAKNLYRIVTSRQKTGTHVSVPIPENVARELLTVLNGNERYVFWSGEGEEESITKNWMKYYVAPCFEHARIVSEGNMKSHRLRDTFACDLLEKGVPLEEVSKLLGHTSIKTTERSYAKWVKGRQDRLDNLVTATWA